MAPIKSVFMFFQVGRVKIGANAVKTDIISGVIASNSLYRMVFSNLKILVLSALATSLTDFPSLRIETT
jgi:hypothetical protein